MKYSDDEISKSIDDMFADGRKSFYCRFGDFSFNLYNDRKLYSNDQAIEAFEVVLLENDRKSNSIFSAKKVDFLSDERFLNLKVKYKRAEYIETSNDYAKQYFYLLSRNQVIELTRYLLKIKQLHMFT